MKQIYFCRHAQAGESDCGDFYRELTEEGKQQAIKMATAMVKDRARPEMLLCSPALRAVQTAAILAEYMEYPEQRIIVEPCLYEQDFETIVRFLRGIDRNLNKLMLVAHNPTMSALAGWITGNPVDLPVAKYVRVLLHVNDWNSAMRFKSITHRKAPPLSQAAQRANNPHHGYNPKRRSDA